MLEWEHVPERLGPEAPGWAVQENENDTRLCPEGLGRSLCCSSVRSPTPSHTQTFQIKWEVYFSKNCVVRLYYCLYMYSAWNCIWLYNSSIPSGFMPKPKKKRYLMLPYNAQDYKVRIKGKLRPSRERRSTLPYILKREPFGWPSSAMVVNSTFLLTIVITLNFPIILLYHMSLNLFWK